MNGLKAKCRPMRITDRKLFPDLEIWPEVWGYLYDNPITWRREQYTPSGRLTNWVSGESLIEYFNDGHPVTKFGYFSTKPDEMANG